MLPSSDDLSRRQPILLGLVPTNRVGSGLSVEPGIAFQIFRVLFGTGSAGKSCPASDRMIGPYWGRSRMRGVQSTVSPDLCRLRAAWMRVTAS